MQRVFVLDRKKQPLMPCHPARARELLTKGKAAVYRQYPFTLILKEREGGDLQPIETKFDPGSKTTGIAIVAVFKRGKVVLWAAHLVHKGQEIKRNLDSRRATRRGRRHRNLRYRKPRFNHRTRPKGGLAPSIQSRVDNVFHWRVKLIRLSPITAIAVETVRFDMQKMSQGSLSGIEYQQGTLQGYEVREYLLEKFKRTGVYCDKKDVPLEVEHIHPKSKGGSDRISNLTLSCKSCNQKKGNTLLTDGLQDKDKVDKLLRQAKTPLKDAAAVNASRYAIGNALKSLGLPTTFWSGGRTKKNRRLQNYLKDHWIDAACVGESGENIIIPKGLKPLQINAVGRGNRQMCRVDQYGFPRTKAKQCKQVRGFQSGDIVKARVPKGKKKGTYTGKVAIRASGSFNVKTKEGIIQGINWKHFTLLQGADGYGYSTDLPLFCGAK